MVQNANFSADRLGQRHIMQEIRGQQTDWSTAAALQLISSLMI